MAELRGKDADRRDESRDSGIEERGGYPSSATPLITMPKVPPGPANVAEPQVPSVSEESPDS